MVNATKSTSTRSLSLDACRILSVLKMVTPRYDPILPEDKLKEAICLKQINDINPSQVKDWASDTFERGLIDNLDAYGDTLLIRAVFTNKPIIVQALLASHASIEIRDFDGFTALDVATRKGHAEVVGLIEKHINQSEASSSSKRTSSLDLIMGSAL